MQPIPALLVGFRSARLLPSPLVKVSVYAFAGILRRERR
jgi:hypothetical protein